MRLKYKEVREYRQQQLERQDYRCALCGDVIIDDAVLDHDHKTGLLRKVLHRGCNALEGKITNNLARNKMTMQRLRVFAERLVDYIETQHTDIQHPTYKEKTMPGRGRGRKPPKR